MADDGEVMDFGTFYGMWMSKKVPKVKAPHIEARPVLLRVLSRGLV